MSIRKIGDMRPGPVKCTVNIHRVSVIGPISIVNALKRGTS